MKIDSYVLPKVHFAAEKIRKDVAHPFAQSVKDLTNRVVLNAAHKIQKGAQYLSNEVAPVLEDKVIAISNAAVPVVNKGIDAVGNSFQAGVNVVSKTTSDGIEQIGQKVLGEQRHSRIKKIANNLSINFNNSINSLAGKIKKVTEHDNLTHKQHLQYAGPLSLSNANIQYKIGYPPNYYPAASTNPIASSNTITTTKQETSESEDETTNNNLDHEKMTMPQALRKLVSNTAYKISEQILGTNLTEAVAPIARSVSDAISKNLPTVTAPNQVVSNEPSEKLRTCTTPEGQKGFCQDLRDCPDLVLKLSVLRRSICFKRLFSPGVCCPDVGQL